ncbi:gamma-glutamyltransferase [Magnetospirillum fulvum]|uniref:gamma-glutamyltransferase n=1 Tax=Magnetospirillum fulvum TaxID=1082 RepID=UPI000942987B|nr:gamma-glutamyltransferase [Magnetospirillum fulvum]
MRVNKDHSSPVERLHAGRRRRLAALTVVLALSGCIDSTPPIGTVGHVRGFAGLVAADEPRAAVVARDVLSAGGNAADAATALYYTLAVTLPSTASLGGGGSCIVHDVEKKTTEILEFPALPSSEAGQVTTAVPANPRGFYALHAKFGLMRFESLVAEPERLARLGTPVSRALANDLTRVVPLLSRDPSARAIFFRPDGAILREGDILRQPELAAVIANLRRNTGDFYLGMAARDLVKSVKSAGGTLNLDDLRDLRPVWRDTLKVRVGSEIAHFAPPPSVGSTVTAELIGMVWPRWSGAGEDERPHLLAEAQARAFADRARWMQRNGWSNEAPGALIAPEKLDRLIADYTSDRHRPVAGASATPPDANASTSFAVLDGSGSAVVCGIGSGAVFGQGVVAPGTGIVLAAAPGPGAPPSATTVMVVNPHTNRVFFAAGSSGGAAAPAALAQTLLAALAEDKPLAEAVARPRVVHLGTPDAAFVEVGAHPLDPAPLTRRGHQIGTVTMPSRVEALRCREGLLQTPDCEAATDPRGSGLATSVGKD